MTTWFTREHEYVSVPWNHRGLSDRGGSGVGPDGKYVWSASYWRGMPQEWEEGEQARGGKTRFVPASLSSLHLGLAYGAEANVPHLRVQVDARDEGCRLKIDAREFQQARRWTTPRHVSIHWHCLPALSAARRDKSRRQLQRRAFANRGTPHVAPHPRQNIGQGTLRRMGRLRLGNPSPARARARRLLGVGSYSGESAG